MLKGTRSLSLDVCDYQGTVVCNLYDSTSDVSGQATDVFVKTERNGWKELSFTLPTTCITAEGEEENYRLNYLIADYRIRLQKGFNGELVETDWYLISEPRVTHNSFSKNVDVVAGHICQLLKTKNMGLEFSDEEGNNGGTAEQILTTILEGTGWTKGIVYPFLEDDGETEKYRTITAPAKSGSFKLISVMCDKFDAKPIYHGDTRTVDIIPMNPFSEVVGSEIPPEVLNENVNAIELNYGTNVSRLGRTLNTTNLITRLYAYGSWGDNISDYCSLNVCEHSEHRFTFQGAHPGTIEYKISDIYGTLYYFTATDINRYDNIVWSELDPLSKSYVYNETQNVIYDVYKEPNTDSAIKINATTETVQNWFDYVMDFSYYEKIGLLTKEMKKTLADYQRTTPPFIKAAHDATIELGAREEILSNIAESNTGFLRLDVGSYSIKTEDEKGFLTLNLRKTDNYPDGVMYRSDYNESKRNYFSWYCASKIKENGDPVSGIGSVVYIIHKKPENGVQTWEKYYVKYIDGEEKTLMYGSTDFVEPSNVTLWHSVDSVPTLSSGDRIYLFCTNSITGKLGARESELEATETTLQNATKVVTELHPVSFVWDNEQAPDPPKDSWSWYYRSYSNNMNMGDLYFNFDEALYHRALLSDSEPEIDGNGKVTLPNGSKASVNYMYYFNTRTKRLYHGVSNKWVIYEDDVQGKQLSTGFSKVAYYCLRHDQLYKGLYDEYVYPSSEKLTKVLPAGNYAVKTDFEFYWVFTLANGVPKNGYIKIDAVNNQVYRSNAEELAATPEAKPFDTIDFPIENELTGTRWYQGTLGAEENNAGTEIGSNAKYRCNNITVHGGTEYAYHLPETSMIFQYTQRNRYISHSTTSTVEGTITLSNRTKYVRIVIPGEAQSSYTFGVNDYLNKLFVSDTEYTLLRDVKGKNDRTGIMYLIKAFADTADACYLGSNSFYGKYKKAINDLKKKEDVLTVSLGDLHREGYWQKNDYVEGDQNLLYKDSIENLVKVAKPEATYDVTFLDLYGSNQGPGYSVDGGEVEWPDIEITDAVHLIDQDIDVNCWAFIDKIEKCYDKPWQTRLEINTNLSLIGQHTFTDVVAHIADVANETTAKQTLYNRAATLTGSGKLAANKLEGAIKANVTTLLGGSSNWYTDSKGNIVLESVDGQSAMMLTGSGWCVANSKDVYGDWNWRYTTTGNGMTADFITAGTISGVLIEAGSITTDQINASVGQELDIGSNTGLLLFATVDGLRPSGALSTKVDNGDGTFGDVGEHDSYIEIKAGKAGATKPEDKAQINIATGGIMNLYGSIMNLTAGSDMNITGSTVKITSTKDDIGSMSFESGGSLNIDASGEFLVNSTNFKIAKNEDVYGGYAVTIMGTVKATAGSIAGFNIVSDVNLKSGAISNGRIYYGSDGLDSTDNGIYIGVDGINIGGGRLYYKKDGAILTAAVKKLLVGGSTSESDNSALIAMDSGAGTITLSASKTINLGAGDTINIGAEDTINMGAGSTINIAAKKSINILTLGTVNIGNADKPFTIGSNSENSYIYNEKETIDDATKDGIYLGTNGIALGKGKFIVTDEGFLTATSGLIAGWGITEFEISHIEKNKQGTVTGALVLSSSSKNEFSILAGGVTDGASAFWVKKDGSMKATKAEIEGEITATGGEIGGWKIVGNTIISANKKVGLNSNQNNNDNTVAFWAGDLMAGSPNFVVTHGGVLTAKGASIDGAIIATSGWIGAKNSNGTFEKGWIIDESKIYSANQVAGMQAVPGTNNANVAFWAGKKSKTQAEAKAPFYVTHAGSLHAEDIDVTGTVHASTLYIGDNDAPANISLDDNGKIVLSATSFDSLGNATGSGIYITPTSIAIGTNGTFSLQSDNFVVTTDGTIYAKAGQIGATYNSTTKKWENGWMISSNAIVSSNYQVGLNSKRTNNTTIALYAGATVTNDVPDIAGAKFRVTYGGALTATSATIAGTINATGGRIGSKWDSTSSSYTGGWVIQPNYIESEDEAIRLQSSTNEAGTTRAIYVKKTSDETTTYPFYVRHDGYLYAENANVKGTIKASNLYIGDVKSKLSVNSSGYITLGSLAKTDNGNNVETNIDKAAGITVDSKTGEILLSTAKFDSLGDSSSGIYITPTSIVIGTTGTFELKSTNFTVDTDGTIKAIKGEIGGWTIGEKKLYSGTGDTYVGLSSDGTTDYAFWCGNSDVSEAPFTVCRSGAVTIKKLSVDGEEIDFSTFNNAVSLSGAWNGTDFKVTAKLWNKNKLTKTENLKAKVRVIEARVDSCAIGEASGGGARCPGTVVIETSIGESKRNWTEDRITVDATQAYDAGWTEATEMYEGDYDQGWNDCIDYMMANNAETVYSRDRATYGGATTHYYQDGSRYISCGSGWYQTYSITRYTLPDKKP